MMDALLTWYDQHSRDLPWRRNPDPYRVWVSEIMLQQTRVEIVSPYYQRWLELFPDLPTLARASLEEVLKAWEGLGYYSRARNLHRAAQVVMDRYDGELPSDPRALQRLPGIGRYTAGAIASIAYGLDVPTLDGNIRRVLARLFNVVEPVRSSQGERLLWELAASILPAGQAGAHNQALMELGATVCTARNPGCGRCPLAAACPARLLGVQEQRPVSQARRALPHYTVTAAVIHRDGLVMITQRPVEGLLGGLWEFPGGKQRPGEDLVDCLKREIYEELGVDIQVQDVLGVYRHAYTHFRVTLHAFHCTLANGDSPRAIQVNDLKWVEADELGNFPMGKIDRQIAKTLQDSI